MRVLKVNIKEDIMAKIDKMAEDFFEQKKIALVGVSEERDTGCNLNYQKFKDAGYIVYAINPKIEQFRGDPCYPDLASTPEKADAVFVLARPEVTDQIVQQCIDVGVKHIWMYCMMGTKPGLVESMTSVSQDAVALCHEHGIAATAFIEFFFQVFFTRLEHF